MYPKPSSRNVPFLPGSLHYHEKQERALFSAAIESSSELMKCACHPCPWGHATWCCSPVRSLHEFKQGLLDGLQALEELVELRLGEVDGVGLEADQTAPAPD